MKLFATAANTNCLCPSYYTITVLYKESLYSIIASSTIDILIMDSSSDVLRRYLYETADQLSPSDVRKLPTILQNRLYNLYISLPPHSPILYSYDALFQHLLDQRLINSGDITLLQYILEDLGKTDLLYPFYELVAHTMTGTAVQDRGDIVPQSKKNTSSEFLLLLIQIGHSLSTENVRTMAYLLQDLLSRYKAATIQDGVELLEMVYQRHYITSTHPCFLLTLLKDINREDLCCMVEQYKITNNIITAAVDESNTSNSKPSQHTCCSFLSNFKKKNWSRREYRFRLAMKKMSDTLNPRDLDNMKLLSQSRLPPAMIDKSGTTVLELFWLLEDHGHLSIDDLSFLEDLLEDKSYLIDSIYSQLSSQPASRENSLTRKLKHKVNHSAKSPEENLSKSFQKMLKLIGNGLTQKDTKHLKILTDSNAVCCAHESIKTGVELVSYWQRYSIVTQSNIELLRKGLCAIGRTDLCTHISEYNCTLQLLHTPPLPQQGKHIIYQITPHTDTCMWLIIYISPYILI